MAIEKTFVKEGIRLSEIQTYLAEKFEKAGYSHSEIQKTALGTKIIVHVSKPGLIIGRSGRKIDELANELKQKFGMENPMIDVKEVENKFLDSKIIASRIADSIQRGINYKKVVNFYLEKVMEAGAVGILVVVSGKLIGNERSLTQKFKAGYIVHSGDYANILVDYGSARANLKVGMVGIKVKILKRTPKEFEFIQQPADIQQPAEIGS